MFSWSQRILLEAFNLKFTFEVALWNSLSVILKSGPDLHEYEYLFLGWLNNTYCYY